VAEADVTAENQKKLLREIEAKFKETAYSH
jgi:hypothetical protein